MRTQVHDLAHLGQVVIAQEIKNERDTPTLRFLMQTFEEIKHASKNETIYDTGVLADESLFLHFQPNMERQEVSPA